MTNSNNFEKLGHELHSLIKEMNSNGLTTKLCCSRYNHKTKLFIMFDEDTDSEVLFKWDKELKRFNTRHNGQLSLNYSSICNSSRFVGHWALSFDCSATKRKQATKVVWQIADYIK